LRLNKCLSCLKRGYKSIDKAGDIEIPVHTPHAFTCLYDCITLIIKNIGKTTLLLKVTHGVGYHKTTHQWTTCSI